MAEARERVHAVLGLFDAPEALFDAIQKVRAKGFSKLEAYSPYPVHGLDRALGLRRSPLAGMVLVLGLLGVAFAIFLQGWTSAVDYPLITGGKPPFSWQAFLPVSFEIMVFFATFTAGLGMLILLNRLPSFRHPVLASRAIASITRDRFALAIESGGSEIDVAAARAALEDAGAAEIEVLFEPPPEAPLSARFIARAGFAIAISCVAAGLATYWAVKLLPVLPPMSHMEEGPRVDPYETSSYLPGGTSMRVPAPGTVARGAIPYAIAREEEADSLANPLPATKAVYLRGKKVYGDRCAVCHGPKGDGRSALTSAYGASPSNLLSRQVAGYRDGRIFHTITVGKGAMPAYDADIPADDRWAVVRYLRALQRAQDATDEDVEEALRK